MSNNPNNLELLEQIEKIIVTEARSLIELGFDQQALTSVVLGIEWLGALLDAKPLGAKNQSRKRFELVLKLLPPQYWSCHKEVNLYRQLRNKAVHNPWVDSKYIALTRYEDQHMQEEYAKTLFSISRLISDLELLILKLKKNTV